MKKKIYGIMIEKKAARHRHSTQSGLRHRCPLSFAAFFRPHELFLRKYYQTTVTDTVTLQPFFVHRTVKK